MLCKTCRHCGLCSGDGTFKTDRTLSVESGSAFTGKFTPDRNAPVNSVGIALDIGTTTIALRAYSLYTAELIYECGEQNAQCAYGSDVIARLSFEDEKKIRDVLVAQIEKMISLALRNASAFFLSERRGRAVLQKIAVCGNTVMQSFFCGADVNGLKKFPFTYEEKVSSVFLTSEIFSVSFCSENDCADARVFMSPVAGAFVGGDTVSAINECGFFDKKTGVHIMCDVGTNCEMALLDSDTKNIVCTSAAAGPAFEGYGISCGLPAGEGAIIDVDSSFNCTVLGGGKAKGLCGTGLLALMKVLLETEKIDSYGTLKENPFRIADGINFTQDDVRRFQEAKAAVKCGLDSLLEKTNAEGKNITLYLAGGFGTKLNEDYAMLLGMFPRLENMTVVHAGNAALMGACRMLFEPQLHEKLSIETKKITVLDLASEPGFQERYISALDF